MPGKQWNRSHANRRLGEELFRAKEEPEYRFSVVLVELEGLNDSEDRLGYASTKETMWRRAMAFLARDLAADDLCCRLGGDEFLLILSGRGFQEAEVAVDRLRKAWRSDAGMRDLRVRTNFGIASYPSDGAKLEELLCSADETLHADRLRNELIQSAEARRSALTTTSH